MHYNTMNILLDALLTCKNKSAHGGQSCLLGMQPE